MIDHDLDDLLGAYALDAVNEDERKLIDAYLLRSPTARAEVQRHHDVAAAIAASPGEAPAPLWLRIEALLDDRSPTQEALAMPELRPVDRSTANWSPAAGPRPQPSEPTSNALPARPASKPDNRNGWFGRQSRGTAFALPGFASRAVMAFAAVAIVGLGLSVVRLNGTNRSLQLEATAAKLQQSQLSDAAKAETQRANALQAKLVAAANRDVRLEKLLLAPTTKTVTLTSTSGATLAKVIVGADGKGYLLGGDLPKLPKGHTYQLWGVHNPSSAGDGKATSVLSLGVFGQHPESVAFAADSTDPWQTFALTDEQSPGVVTSKQQAIAAGNVEST
jgi:Anti-sigma-K factor rskA